MTRPRKRHEQTSLLDRRGKPMVRDGKSHGGHGGKRAGAGRPPKGERAGAPHEKRPPLGRNQPVHVVLRVARDVGNLRKRRMYRALRAASIAVAKRADVMHEGAFRIVHVSIQRDHVHLLVEADGKTALSRGMQSFEISAAKQLNRAVTIQRMGPVRARDAQLFRARRRRGTVFPDRFHLELITTPRQARHTLAYVLNNWRKHREDRWLDPGSTIDPFSTAAAFDGWKERAKEDVLMAHAGTDPPLVVWLPKSWLLREGWRRHGLVGFREVPSARMLGRC